MYVFCQPGNRDLRDKIYNNNRWVRAGGAHAHNSRGLLLRYWLLHSRGGPNGGQPGLSDRLWRRRLQAGHGSAGLPGPQRNASGRWTEKMAALEAGPCQGGQSPEPQWLLGGLSIADNTSQTHVVL